MSIWQKISENFKSKNPEIIEKAIKENTQYASFLEGKFAKNLVVVTPWNSEKGKRMLLESDYNNSFFHLAHTFQSMANPFYGSVASMVNVLNALRLDKGIVPDSNERIFKLFDRNTGEIREFSFNIYTQNSLLDDETDLVKHREKILPKIKDEVAYVDFDEFNPGLSLMQMKRILEIYKCSVDIFYAHNDVNNGVADFISHLKDALSSDKKFIIANFYGEIIGLHQAGHFSTIAAFHEPTWSVLVLDTASHKHPWYWVSVDQLYHAMNTEAREGNKRGYLVVSDKL
ncbi:MAG: phytochelatin synthase family protein [Rickettsiales bacterium]|nr:phytochelatin synthase family protein [Rickettsiales bacterium]